MGESTLRQHQERAGVSPPFPALQKQVDEYVENDRKEKEEEANKDIKKEYDSPYTKLSIPTELIDGHDDGVGHFHGARNWKKPSFKPRKRGRIIPFGFIPSQMLWEIVKFWTHSD